MKTKEFWHAALHYGEVFGYAALGALAAHAAVKGNIGKAEVFAAFIAGIRAVRALLHEKVAP